MRIILARHGNTFAAGEKVCWVGSRNDLPLVEQGVLQAQKVGQSLQEVPIEAIYFAPLKRTHDFAQIVAEFAKTAPLMKEDKRLTELDYGDWSGLTDDEVAEQFGADALENWVNKSIWPQQSGWASSESIVSEEIRDFIAEITSQVADSANVLIVSSNGRLRYFLKLIVGEFEKRAAAKSFKVATGKVCLLAKVDSKFCVELWNEAPEVLSKLLGGTPIVSA